MARFPFLFLNHGGPFLEAIGKAGDCYVGFRSPPDAKRLAKAVARCPAPLRGSATLTGSLFAIGSPGDTFDWMMLEHYGTVAEKAASAKSGWAELGEETADRFAEDFERWVTALHKTAPIQFVIGPVPPREDDAWHTWSREALAEVLVPLLEAFESEHRRALERDDLDETPPTDAIGVFGRDAFSCLLQHFDALEVEKALRPRVKALRKAFPL